MPIRVQHTSTGPLLHALLSAIGLAEKVSKEGQSAVVHHHRPGKAIDSIDDRRGPKDVGIHRS
jgi:hypothetical protein